jgi:hypothetical protein
MISGQVFNKKKRMNTLRGIISTIRSKEIKRKKNKKALEWKFNKKKVHKNPQQSRLARNVELKWSKHCLQP